MKYLKTFLIIFFSACFLAAPVVSQATYAPEYLEYFSDIEWQTMTEGTMANGDAYYMVSYTEDGVQADYWYVYNEDYTSEWYLYSDDDSGDSEAFTNVASTDATYQDAMENWVYPEGAYWGSYDKYTDGSTYEHEVEYWDNWYSPNYIYYSEEVWNEASGSYGAYYDYDSRWVSWSFEVEYDLSWSSYSESTYIFDVTNEAWSSYRKEQSLTTGSFWEYQWDYTMTSREEGGEWYYQLDTYQETASSYSADFSQTWSSYVNVGWAADSTEFYGWDRNSYKWRNYDWEWTYLDASEEWKIEDSGYYFSSYAKVDYTTGEWEYSATGYDNYMAQNITGDARWGTESTWSSYSTGKRETEDDVSHWFYDSYAYEFSSGHSYFYENGKDWMGGSLEGEKRYNAWNGNYDEYYYRVYYDGEGYLGGEQRESGGNDFTGAWYMEEWTEDVVDNALTYLHTFSGANARRADEYSGYEYLTDSNYSNDEELGESSIYIEQSFQRTNLDSGTSEQSYNKYWKEGSSESGFGMGNDWQYDSAYQESSYYEWNTEYYDNMYVYYDAYLGSSWLNAYSGGSRSLDYSYNEYTLADSDQHEIHWNKWTYSEEDGSSQTYEYYNYTLSSDMATEYWNYNKSDYTGANNTYWYERHEKSLVTDAYEDYNSWQEDGVIDQWQTVGQDLDYYYEETWESTYVASASGWSDYYSEYELSRSSGNQWWEEQTYVASTGNETWTTLSDGAGAWTGEKIEYNAGTDTYNLYLYHDYPGSFVLIEDIDNPYDW